MAQWAEFAAQEPEIAAAGWRLLGADGVAIGFLATAGPAGRPHLAPVCPIFAGGRLYVSVPPATPKCRDLAQTGHYVLHAFLGPQDEEFAITGHAGAIDDPDERATVHAAIRFGSFHREHPIFHLGIASCRWVRWDDPGAATTRRRIRRWGAERLEGPST